MELMIVVVVVGILLNIAIPSFLRARESARAKACIKNLQYIDSAKEQYALDNRISSGSPTSANLFGTGLYLRAAPSCPTAGTSAYTINPIGTAPTCIIGANLNSGTWDDHIMP
jgi:type II secretory pathway pseudopilin PulG